jgi:hypothetical protein
MSNNEESQKVTLPVGDGVPVYRIALVRESIAIESPSPAVRKSSDAAQVLRPLFTGLDREQFVVLMLDAQHRPVGMNVVSLGSLTASLVHPREVFKPAILTNSTEAQPTSGLTDAVRAATAAGPHTAARHDGREPTTRAATARRGPKTPSRMTKAGLRQRTRATSRPSTATTCTCTARSSIRSGNIGRARSCGGLPAGAAASSSTTRAACRSAWRSGSSGPSSRVTTAERTLTRSASRFETADHQQKETT